MPYLREPEQKYKHNIVVSKYNSQNDYISQEQDKKLVCQKLQVYKFCIDLS